jgi:hypothetical protein
MIDTREELVLLEAAELEHGLPIQYLFALAHVLQTSSADLHASPEQALNAARRCLRYARLAPSSIRLLSW